MRPVGGTLNEVEAEIEDLRQQIDDAERLAMEGAGSGWHDGTTTPLPPPLGKIGKIMGRLNKPGQMIGALKGSEKAMEYLTTELYPRRSELEGVRQDLLKQKAEAEKALAEAQSALDSAADEYRQCREEDDGPPDGER